MKKLSRQEYLESFFPTEKEDEFHRNFRASRRKINEMLEAQRLEQTIEEEVTRILEKELKDIFK